MEMLFNFIINSTADIKLKQAAAVFLKEYVSKYWVRLFGLNLVR